MGDVMDFKELMIKKSYISFGEENIAKSLIVPALKCSKTYKRSVGFFSSSVLITILDGVSTFVRNEGKIYLIASPNLSQEDIDAINAGYAKKEQIIRDSMERCFDEEIEKLGASHLMLLAELIANDYLDIQIAVTENNGIYHDKLGILEDLNGNKIVFFGSPNSSMNAYELNYEKIRVARSWIDTEKDIVEDEISEFDSLWNKNNPYVTVYEYKEIVHKKVLKVIEKKISTKENNSTGITLRDYQEAAISAWNDNGNHGFFVMATGTGKTWTAIFAAKRLLEFENCLTVICAPYKHLVKQWSEDVKVALPEATIILVSSENPTWEKEVRDAIVKQKVYKNKQVVIITTIISFSLNRFTKAISKSNHPKLLIVDEAHRFTKRPDSIKDEYKYMLGLSATPFNGKDAVKGNELMNFFGGCVFNLPIENALERGFLVPYNYYPIYVRATEEEEAKFQNLSKKMAGCFRDGILIDKENLLKFSKARLRLISMAEEKTSKIDNILEQVDEKDHFIVYCGDGRVFDNPLHETRHINYIKTKLSNKNFKASQFTATENMKERMELVDVFNKGLIDALVAIKCLDEGINIPSIKGALVLSSNDDFREFTQRRGRILRLYPGKDFANIYDVIVLPSPESTTFAIIELRRFFEYAHLASNAAELMQELEYLMGIYGLNYEDIQFNFDVVEEDILDE